MIKKFLNLLGMMFVYFSLGSLSYANSKAIIILPNTIISHTSLYENVALDLSNGNFKIINNATLIIKNCTLNGVISPANPVWFHVVNGKIHLEKNHLQVSANHIHPVPDKYNHYKLIYIFKGKIALFNNTFSVDKAYTVGLLSNDRRQIISDTIIKENDIQGFHGGLILMNANHIVIENNSLSRVSLANIFLLGGAENLIKDNTILFSGNNNVGDSIDIFDEENDIIINNFIAQGSCYGIYILRSKNILLAKNKIIGGITYGIYLASSPNIERGMSSILNAYTFKILQNSNITITDNLLSQNRFGIGTSSTGLVVDKMIVRHNIFIQRFNTHAKRKFWTNNDILLHNATRVLWIDNLYKEAFTQKISDDNMLAFKFITYPAHGGVNLSWMR